MQFHRMEMLDLLNNGYRKDGKALRTVEVYKDGVRQGPLFTIQLHAVRAQTEDRVEIN